MSTARDKAIDQYSRGVPLRALTPEEIIKAIAQVLEENLGGPAPAAGSPQSEKTVGGGELGVIYIYTQLCAHPERYGFESENQLPLMPDFAAICTGRFPSRREGSKVFIRPVKGLWDK